MKTSYLRRKTESHFRLFSQITQWHSLCKLLATMKCNILPQPGTLSDLLPLLRQQRNKGKQPLLWIARVFEKRKRPQLCPWYYKAVNQNHDYNEMFLRIITWKEGELRLKQRERITKKYIFLFQPNNLNDDLKNSTVYQSSTSQVIIMEIRVLSSQNMNKLKG